MHDMSSKIMLSVCVWNNPLGVKQHHQQQSERDSICCRSHHKRHTTQASGDKEAQSGLSLVVVIKMRVK